MASAGYCFIDDTKIGSSRKDIDSDLISLFRPENKIITSSIPEKFTHNREFYQKEMEEYPDLKIVYYEAPINIIRDRLNIIGYDLETTKEAFREWVKGELKVVRSKIQEQDNKQTKISDQLKENYENEYELLSCFTPELWMENFKIINESNIPQGYQNLCEGPYKGTILGHMLSINWYGFPGYDTFIPLRLALEALDDSKKLIYDLTELVWEDYFDIDEDFVQYGFYVSVSDFVSRSRIIVLTEGKSDARILRKTFDLLYPHLQEYYSFLDFETSRFGGGVGNLVNVVKAFAGSGIVNNIFALFDNDTAAISACKDLEKVSLPSNIVVRHLPNLELLKNYPALGPSGLVNLDINGMASSIELFFGEDVLRSDEVNLMPIQWTGYDRSLGQYQGEVIEKDLLHSRFDEKLKRAFSGENLDWSDLNSIFHMIFNAFSKKNKKIICKRPIEYYSNF